MDKWQQGKTPLDQILNEAHKKYQEYLESQQS